MKEDRFEQRMRREITNLYSNEGLTSSLNDSSAKIFLNWAEKQVRKIVESTVGMDDELADEMIVITSYSIHYTKLYEHLLRSAEQAAALLGLFRHGP